ncbi:MAG: isochorismate synthase [Deltaproteobacteria bacterium]|nr:isochorismate synthase [Deltaproteobacteria bacterium]
MNNSPPSIEIADMHLPQVPSPSLSKGSVADEHGLDVVLGRARELAASRGEATLLRIQLAARLEDPWTAWKHLESRGLRVEAAWSDPATGARGLAAGAADSWHGVAWSETQRACSSFCERLLEWSPDGGLDPSLPFLFAGRAFETQAPGPGGPWQGWPSTYLFAPRLLLWRRGDETRAAVTLAVDAHTPSGRARREIERFTELVRAEPPAERRAPRSAFSPAILADERGRFTRLVEEAKDAIRASTLDKIVVARALLFAAEAGHRFDLPATLERLRDHEPQAFVFALRGPGGSAFVGATPEVLARVDRDRVETVALAGTAARGETPEEDQLLARSLLSSQKDRHEQAIVVEQILSALEPVLESCVAAAEPHIARFGRVQHLATPIGGALRPGESLLSVVGRLHPTPAVAGAPRDGARAWLKGHERLERGWYTGAIGHLDRTGSGTFVVALRSALLTPAHAVAYAGAGIVAASDPDREWSETELKLAAIAGGLATAEERR